MGGEFSDCIFEFSYLYSFSRCSWSKDLSFILKLSIDSYNQLHIDLMSHSNPLLNHIILK